MRDRRSGGCYDPGIDDSTKRATGGLKRLLTLFWHTLGFWAVAFGAASFAGRGRGPVTVLGAFAVVWLLGLVWAAVKRRRTVLARVVGLGFAALPLVGAKLDDPDLTWAEMGGWFVRRRPDRAAGGMLIALGLLAVVVLLQVLFARAFRIQAERRGRDPARPRFHAFGFPLTLAGALFILQCFPLVTMVVVLAGAAAWMIGLVGAAEARDPLKPRWIGFGLAVLLIGGWPPVSLDACNTEIVVAVLRYRMADADGLCFVRVRGEDPSPDVLRALADLPVRVRPVSAAVFPNWVEDENARDVTDRDTGERGVVYSVGSVRRSFGNPMTVEVEGSTCSGVLGGGGGTYYVTWLFGYWVVVDYTMRWIS